ncbi:MAG TPA: endolytic transglycosylase MltG [Verrucomicrobiae bacterium]|nr:endolytic transglycosylase MltG [Verrucomicrobiae bacterium]
MKALLTVLLLLVLVVAAVAGYVWVAIEKPYGQVPAEGVFVEIPHGVSQRTVSRLLASQGIVRSAAAFELYARRHPRRSLQAGEYFFDHAMSGKEVYWKIANGEVYVQPFTVKEGDTIYDIAHNLETAKYMMADEFVKAAQDASQVKDLAPGAKTLEGFLYPATYNLPRHASGGDLTTMMVRKFREAMQQIAPERLDPQTPGTSLLSVITLASIVEAETPKPEERPLVAGVYTNRLRKDMLLQCDPTVIYALRAADKYKPPLLLKDLAYASPYNTYVHAGLPPGPIGNPGETSIRAALSPAPTDYLYFVANTQGGHFFAATLAEHNQNVAKYHRLLNGEAADPPVPETPHTRSAGAAHKGKR